jgi:Uma2 family endonuclease
VVATRARIIDEDAPLIPGELDGISLDEFLALPEATPALEYEDGRVTQKVAPLGRHSVLQGALRDFFQRTAAPGKVAFAFTELRTTYHSTRRSFVPDVAVYRWDRIPRSSTGEVADRFTEPPDIAVEVASPDQSIPSLVRKCAWFVGHGVRAALLVDPDHRTVRLFRLGQPPVVLRGADVVDLTTIIPGFQVTVDEVFASLRLA